MLIPIKTHNTVCVFTELQGNRRLTRRCSLNIRNYLASPCVTTVDLCGLSKYGGGNFLLICCSWYSSAMAESSSYVKKNNSVRTVICDPHKNERNSITQRKHAIMLLNTRATGNFTLVLPHNRIRRINIIKTTIRKGFVHRGGQ